MSLMRMHSWTLYLLILCGALFSNASKAFAQPPQPRKTVDQSLTGVWQGTIGNLPITACFNPLGEYETTQNGSYYYRNHGQPIHLDQKKSSSVFEESQSQEKSKPRWEIQASPDLQQLKGTWTSTGGLKTLPIALQRITKNVNISDNEETEFPCQSDAYLNPIEKPLPLMQGKTQYFQGKPYRVLTRGLAGVGEIQTIQLVGDQYKSINAQLVNLADEGHLFSCRRFSMHRGLEGMMLRGTNEVSLWGHRWLVIDYGSEDFCGGAHPNHWRKEIVYDLHLNRQVNLSMWVRGINRSTNHTVEDTNDLVPTPRLHQLIVKHSDAMKYKNQDCLDAFSFERYYSVSLSQKGLSFSPNLPHVIQACGEDIVIPYAQLMPFLTPLGKREVAKIQQQGF